MPPEEQAAILRVLDRFRRDGIEFHALRTRQAGARRFVSLHVLVPPDWTVARGHALEEQIEGAIRQELMNSSVTTHLEPLRDPTSWLDTEIDRRDE